MILKNDEQSIQNVQIDDEFKKLCPQLSFEERRQLKNNILSDGEFLEPLIVWDGILIDGHNRLEIWQEFTDEERQQIQPPQIKLVEFSDHAAAHDWILNNQLGRRNLSPSQRAHYIGQLYQSEKKNVADNLKSVPSGEGKFSVDSKNIPEGQNVSQTNSTAEKIGKTFGISGKQVQRNAKFSKALETIEQTLGVNAKEEILNGQKKTPMSQVVMMANLPTKEMQQAFDMATGRAAPPEPAKPQFDDKKLVSDLGRVMRHIDDRLRLCGGKAEHQQCMQLIKKVFAIHDNWKKSHF